MKLLTAKLKKLLPPIYSQEKESDPIVYCKFFTPDSSWTWYITEGEPVEEDSDNWTFFGYVIGLEKEWGYFQLEELESLRGPFGLSVERDIYFEPQNFSKLKGVE